MNLKDFKVFSSVKYIYQGNVSKHIAPLSLKGIFYWLENPKSEKYSLFLGFANGTNKLSMFAIKFVDTDIKIERAKNIYYNNDRIDLFTVNIKHFSPTRLPQKVSTPLREYGKKLNKIEELRIEKERFEQSFEKKERDAMLNLDSIRESLKGEVPEDYDSFTADDAFNHILKNKNLGNLLGKNSKEHARIIPFKKDYSGKILPRKFYISEELGEWSVIDSCKSTQDANKSIEEFIVKNPSISEVKKLNRLRKLKESEKQKGNAKKYGFYIDYVLLDFDVPDSRYNLGAFTISLLIQFKIDKINKFTLNYAEALVNEVESIVNS